MDNDFPLTSLLEFLDERLDGFFRPLFFSFLFFCLLITQQSLDNRRLRKKAGHLQARSNTFLSSFGRASTFFAKVKVEMVVMHALRNVIVIRGVVYHGILLWWAIIGKFGRRCPPAWGSLSQPACLNSRRIPFF